MGIYKKGKNYYIDYYVFGRRKRECIGPSKQLAITVLQKRNVEIAEGKYLDKKKVEKIYFSVLASEYLKRLTKKSKDRDARSIKHLNAFFGNKLITEITPSMIYDYIKHRQDENSFYGTPTKPATINRELACMKTIYSKAIKDGKGEKNPVSLVKLLPENNVRDRVLTEEEFERLLNASPHYLKPILLTAYHTGMRKSEILNLTWDKIDLKGGYIKLKAEDTKTNEARIIPMGNRLIEVFNELARVRALNSNKVFLRDGQPIRDIRKAFEGVCKKVNVKDFIFHDFRHTFTTNMRRAGVDYLRIMKITGHKTMSVFKRYNTIDDEDLRGAIAKMDTYMDTKASLDTHHENPANPKSLTRSMPEVGIEPTRPLQATGF